MAPRCDGSGNILRPTIAAAAAASTQPPAAVTEEVDLDLRHGIVKGYSQYISFLSSPSPVTESETGTGHGSGASAIGVCSARAVVRVDLAGPFNRVRLSLDYDRARLWTLDMADSPTADGYGGGAGGNGTENERAQSEDSMAETQVYRLGRRELYVLYTKETRWRCMAYKLHGLRTCRVHGVSCAGFHKHENLKKCIVFFYFFYFWCPVTRIGNLRRMHACSRLSLSKTFCPRCKRLHVDAERLRCLQQ